MPDGNTITIRLDNRTDDKLAKLIEHFDESDALGRPANASQIVRAAIDEMFTNHLTQENS